MNKKGKDIPNLPTQTYKKKIECNLKNVSDEMKCEGGFF